MTATAEPQRRSFPRIEFTDAEAGALEFPSSKSRTYNYYKPAKLRATTYEDVTVDVQPDPERHLSQAGSTDSATAPEATRRNGRSRNHRTGTSSGIRTRSGTSRSTATTRRSSGRWTCA